MNKDQIISDGISPTAITKPLRATSVIEHQINNTSTLMFNKGMSARNQNAALDAITTRRD